MLLPVFFGFFGGPVDGIFAGLLAGILADVYGGTLLGTSAFLFVCFGFLSGSDGDRMNRIIDRREIDVGLKTDDGVRFGRIEVLDQTRGDNTLLSLGSIVVIVVCHGSISSLLARLIARSGTGALFGILFLIERLRSFVFGVVRNHTDDFDMGEFIEFGFRSDLVVGRFEDDAV